MRATQWIIFLGLLILTFSCKSTDKISSPKGKKLTEKQLEKRLTNPVIPEEWLHAKGKLSVDLPEFKGSGTYRMYLQRDKALWMQVTKFGFEVGRVLITPDSLIALNRMQNTYIKGGIKDIERIFGTSVNFDQLQYLIWGLPPVYHKSADIRSEKNYFLISGTDPLTTVSFLYSILAPFEIVSGFLEMKPGMERETHSLEFKNDDYQPLTNEYNFPYLRNYHLVSPQNEIQIEMSVSNVELGEEKELRLVVPDHYDPYTK